MFGKPAEPLIVEYESTMSDAKLSTHEGLLVFISHSSKDADLALALIDLLKAAFALRTEQIRCSSVDGYRLPVGVNTESKLREEVNAAKVVVGLITPNSLSSYYVMFELGARWGANLFLAPLLAGVKASDLSGPLSLLNALSASSDAQLHQLLEDTARHLRLQVQPAASYVRNITAVKALADVIANPTANPITAAPVKQKLRMTISAEGTPRGARSELNRMSLQFTAKDFLQTIARNELDTVKVFLAAKIDPNAEWDDETALMCAIRVGNRKIIDLVLKARPDINATTHTGFYERTALGYATKDESLLRLLLRKGVTQETKNKAFVTAARSLNIKAMQILLEKGADGKAVGAEALIEAAGAGEGGEGRESVRFLLSRGIDPNATNGRWTALLRAAREGPLCVAKLLLEHGADVNAVCHESGNLCEGWTALMMAVLRNNREMAELLVQNKADVNMRNDSGETALIIAATHGDSGSGALAIVEMLLDHGADLDAETQDRTGNNALTEAVYNKRIDIVRVLLRRGANVNKKSKLGRTALYFATTTGDPGLVADLLNHGSDINTPDFLGVTPLMQAAKYADPEIVSLLLARGASVHEIDTEGKTALQFAQERRVYSEEDKYQQVQIVRALTAAAA